MRHVRRHPPFPPGHAAAFAEGRRLREMSRMRPYPPMPPSRRIAPGWLFPVLAIPIGLMAVSFLTVLFSLLAFLGEVAWAAVPVMPFVLVGGASIAVSRGLRRAGRRAALRRGGAPGTVPLPPRPVAQPRPDVVWAHAHRRFAALRTAYAAYECDPMAVLRLPALADVTVPSTARFVDAFAEAQALDTDAFPGLRHGGSYIAAVDRAERAWRAAREAAERIRLSNLSPDERHTVERVIKLLTTARDSDSDAERVAAYARARSELAKLDKAGAVHVPLPAQTALAEAARGALPA